MKENKRKPARNLVNFIKSEAGGISQDKVIKIGGLTLGLLAGMSGQVFAPRTHADTVDLVFNAGAPSVGTHANTVSWSWGWGNWSACSCA
ncbi:MAG: hypothetical protein HZA49_11385 [Planctomycetes bacterium]|nr:hypothetical protein [Planctomycetota bacterium]